MPSPGSSSKPMARWKATEPRLTGEVTLRTRVRP